MLAGMARGADPVLTVPVGADRLGYALFAYMYALLSETLVCKILGHLPCYMNHSINICIKLYNTILIFVNSTTCLIYIFSFKMFLCLSYLKKNLD